MVADLKVFANEVQSQNLELEVVAINMSKTDIKAAKIEEVPVVRLFKKNGQIIELKSKSILEDLKSIV